MLKFIEASTPSTVTASAAAHLAWVGVVAAALVAVVAEEALPAGNVKRNQHAVTPAAIPATAAGQQHQKQASYEVVAMISDQRRFASLCLAHPSLTPVHTMHLAVGQAHEVLSIYEFADVRWTGTYCLSIRCPLLTS
jgi:hypothetical protein